MKKIASFALLAALLLSGTAGFAACGERTPSDSSDSVSQPDIAPNSVLLYDFEEYVTDVEPLILLNYFGKVTLNEDKQYVRNGSVITFHDSIKSEPRLKYTLSNSSWLYVQGIR